MAVDQSTGKPGSWQAHWDLGIGRILQEVGEEGCEEGQVEVEG